MTYDPALDPDYPLNRLADKYGALRPDPPKRGPYSRPQVLNWRTHGHQVYPPLTPADLMVGAWFPPCWPLLWFRIIDQMRQHR